MSLPDWQLPPGVDRGLWDYLHAADMVAGYDAQMAASPLAAADVAFCDKWFPTPGGLIDLGCGTGRLCRHFGRKGGWCVGIDLSDAMLARAGEALRAEEMPGSRKRAIRFFKSNLLELDERAGTAFDYATCLFSTLGMVRGADNRAKVVANAFRLLRPGGRFVLHVHNRFFAGLGRPERRRQVWRWLLRRPDAGDVTMPQAYGGAPLTLHHFTRREAVGLLTDAGFVVREVLPIGTDGRLARRSAGTYGYLLAAGRPG